MKKTRGFSSISSITFVPRTGEVMTRMVKYTEQRSEQLMPVDLLHSWVSVIFILTWALIGQVTLQRN